MNGCKPWPHGRPASLMYGCTAYAPEKQCCTSYGTCRQYMQLQVTGNQPQMNLAPAAAATFRRLHFVPAQRQDAHNVSAHDLSNLIPLNDPVEVCAI